MSEAMLDKQGKLLNKVKNRTAQNQSQIESPSNAADNHIKIQNNNFRPSENNNKKTDWPFKLSFLRISLSFLPLDGANARIRYKPVSVKSFSNNFLDYLVIDAELK